MHVETRIFLRTFLANRPVVIFLNAILSTSREVTCRSLKISGLCRNFWIIENIKIYFFIAILAE